MKATTLSVVSTESELINGMTDHNTQGTGEKIKFQESEFTLGLMAGAMKESGLRTIWKAWVSTFGTMVVCTKVSTKTIKNMDSVSIPGLIRDVTKDTGTRENNMDLELT